MQIVKNLNQAKIVNSKILLEMDNYGSNDETSLKSSSELTRAPSFDREVLSTQKKFILDSMIVVDDSNLEKHPLNDLFEHSVENQKNMLGEISKISTCLTNIEELDNSNIVDLEFEAEKIRCKLSSNYIHAEELIFDDLN